MKNIFLDTRPLDENARKHFGLTEDIMMENAAAALEEAGRTHIGKKENYIQRPAILILTGKGNNGADGFALARRLMCHENAITVCMVEPPASPMCILQKERAEKIGVQFIDLYGLDEYLEEKSFDLEVIYDCIYGAGFHGALPAEAQAAVSSVNRATDGYRISCDIPSGLDKFGNHESEVFKADETVTMGALKLSLFSDDAKDLAGKITVSNLGLSRNNFEFSTEVFPKAFLLESEDMHLPFRNRKQNTNKGSFGHTVTVQGEKQGAAILASLAAERFGSGLTTILNPDTESAKANLSYPELMNSTDFPSNTTSVILGPGLGRTNVDSEKYFEYLKKNPAVSCVLDADIFHAEGLLDFLKTRSEKTVLTPHPKEFSVLLKNTGLGEYSVQDVIKNRIELAEKFAGTFPGVVLVLKGANVIIAQKNPSGTSLFINTIGTNSLSKGGSGDVLSGLIGSLQAQGRTSLDAAITGSLALGKLSIFSENDFSMTPLKLIENISRLTEGL